MIRKIYLRLLLWGFRIGAFFHWEFAEDQCEDLELALNDEFIAGMRKIIKAVESTDFDIGKVKKVDKL